MKANEPRTLSLTSLIVCAPHQKPRGSHPQPHFRSKPQVNPPFFLRRRTTSQAPTPRNCMVVKPDQPMQRGRAGCMERRKKYQSITIDIVGAAEFGEAKKLSVGSHSRSAEWSVGVDEGVRGVPFGNRTEQMGTRRSSNLQRWTSKASSENAQQHPRSNVSHCSEPGLLLRLPQER